MNPVLNPFAPGAGSQPPELAGRDRLLEQMRIAVERTKNGLSAKSVLLIGLRGVGKTVLLDRMRDDAESMGIQTLRIEAPERRSLPAILAPQLRSALLRLSRIEAAKNQVNRALAGLAGFVRAFKVKFQDIEVALDMEPERGLADNGDLESDLQDLFEVVGESAQAAGTALIIYIDELQYVEEGQLAALIVALHRIAQRRLPMLMVGAGLPQLRGQMGAAKSYAERLFDYPDVGALDAESARLALTRPVEELGVAFSSEALDQIIDKTHGYPYFLQEWGKHAWDVAEQSPITAEDVAKASILAIAALDQSFFAVRLDRLSPSEKRYLRAMAELGPGPHRSGDIAAQLDRKVTALAPTRSSLIEKGMVWSQSHGDTSFTVPLFDEYLRRVMPGQDWRNA